MTYASVEVGSKGLGQRSILLPPKEAIPKARAAALKALQIDDSLAEAHASLGLIAEQYDYDWQTAEREFRRAIELDPDYATGHQWYAEYLSLQGRFDEWLDLPWQTVRDSVEVKLFEQDGELYVLAKSEGRRAKETAMRRKRLARCESWANSNTVHLRNYRVFCLAGGQNIAMARTLASLPTGSRVTDYISLGVVSRAI